jgi:uncharacterized protein (DUF2342 family)
MTDRTAFSNFVDDDLRRALRLQVAMTVPPSHVDEVVDVACHAAIEAIETMQRIAFETPRDQRVAITASTLAMSLIKHRMETLIEISEKVAQQSGMTVRHANLSVQR